MRLILFRLIGILEVAGGFYGMVSVLPSLINVGPLHTAAIGLITFAVFAFILVAGVMLLENSERGVRFSSIAQLLQLPLIATPVVSYSLYAGGFVDISTTLHLPPHPDLNWRFGSEGLVLRFTGSTVSRLGINLLALISWLVLKLR